MAGLLPPLTKGRTVPEFEQAAFSTPKGQTTDIIRTSYGFHIIRVEDKQTARVKPLDEVKAADRARDQAAEGGGGCAEPGELRAERWPAPPAWTRPLPTRA